MTYHPRCINIRDRFLYDEQMGDHGIANLSHAVGSCDSDEGIRSDTSRERLASLKTLRDGGTITAGVASQISDRSAAMLIGSEAAVRTHRLRRSPGCTA
jgi:acetyl-CoA acetyltransferase